MSWFFTLAQVYLVLGEKTTVADKKILRRYFSRKQLVFLGKLRYTGLTPPYAAIDKGGSVWTFKADGALLFLTAFALITAAYAASNKYSKYTVTGGSILFHKASHM